MTAKKATHLERVRSLMAGLPRIRNCSLIGHVDHGKTTLSDSLLASSGLLNPALAGTAHLLDYLDEEQARGITMKSANISLVHEHGGEPLLVNLVDTPGHVDFSGKVTRALRLIDSAIVVVDAVEGVMIQTEHVVRQAIESGVRPLLFINKIDRLVKELDLETWQVQQKFKEIIETFNALVPAAWQVDLATGSVVFGSALDGWGATLARFLACRSSFKDIVQVYKDADPGGKMLAVLKRDLPVHEAILDMVVSNAPSPVEAQGYRIPRIWHGPAGSPVGEALLRCTVDAPTMVFVSKVQVEHGQPTGTGRVFCGSIKRGDEFFLLRNGTREKAGEIGIFMGQRVVAIDEVLAGNIVAIRGMKGLSTGETLLAASAGIAPAPDLAFEQPGYIIEPVVTVSIEPERLADLDRLQRLLELKHVEDPNLVIEESDKTGEILVSGIGPLHLEVTVNEIRKEGIPVYVSDPLALFHEAVSGTSPPGTATSTNGANEITIYVAPVTDREKDLFKHLAAACETTAILDGPALAAVPQAMLDAAGWTRDELGRVFHVTRDMNVVSSTVPLARPDATTLASTFSRVFRHGPLVGESVRQVKIVVERATLARAEAARDPSELVPMARQALFELMGRAGATLLEPVFESTVHGAVDGTGKITSLLAQHGGRIECIDQDGRYITIKARFPVRSSFALIEEARTVTSGRAVFQNVFAGYEPVPKNAAVAIIAGLKARKGLL